MKRIITLLFILSFFLMKGVWSQDTITLQTGPEGRYANLWSYHPGNNYGHTELFHTMGWTYWGETGAIRSLMDFDLSQIPPDAIITEAKLSLYYLNTQPNPDIEPGENESYLQLITSPWDEETVTWNDPPLTTEEDQVYLRRSTEPEQDYPDIDVTTVISKLFYEPENYHGLMLRLINEYPYACMLFASGDCNSVELRPKLEIIYRTCMPPVADFEYQADGQLVSFTGISPSTISWHWDFGDGDTSNVQNPDHVYQEAGIYEVCLRVQDTCDYAVYCEVLDICNMPPLTGFTYVADGLNVDFQDNSEMATAFFWDFGDGYFSNLENPWHAYDTTGSYLVCLITWNNCGSDTVCEILEICITPVSGFNYSIENLTVYFDDISEMAETYFWDFGDGYFSNLANPAHIYDEPGSYEVCLMIWNDCGSDTSCQLIDFNTAYVSDGESGLFSIYPNPARDAVFIQTATNGLAEIMMTDLSGKTVLSMQLEVADNEVIRIPLGQFEPGLYVIIFESGMMRLYNKLIVVQ
jgi:PKD repeat protein